jgi:N-acetylglucosaminyldiphosphoundecaprenol N-acetyl-beta-D-mannosaminyltransferase
MPTSGRALYLGLEFDRLSLSEAVEWVHRQATEPTLTTVVTPNVDHIVRLDREINTRLLSAYEAADLCLCDSRVLSAIARLSGVNLLTVPGSDLTAAVLDSVPKGREVAVIGGDADTLHQIVKLCPHISFSQHIPPMNLNSDLQAQSNAAAWAANSGAHYVLLAVGSPQSELIAQSMKEIENTKGVVLSIGASIDFITGRQNRAPAFVQKLALEWAWRLFKEPRRLARRYLIDGPRIFLIAARGGIRVK